MKEWVVIHKIKALHDNGKGLSIRAISQELGLSRNTVRKYLRMEVDAISERFADPSRSKRLDDHRDYLVHLLQQFPKLSAVKIARKLQERVRRKWPRPRCATTNPFWTMCRVFSVRWIRVSCAAC